MNIAQHLVTGYRSIFVMQNSSIPAPGTHPFTTELRTFGRTVKPGRILRNGAVMVVPACRCMITETRSRKCDTHVGLDQAIILYPGEYEKIPLSQAQSMAKRHIV